MIEKKLNSDSKGELFLVDNLSFTRATVYDLHKIYNQVINRFGYIYIINIGVSDAATREIPRWFADFLFSKKRSIIARILKGFHLYFIKPNRRLLVKLRGKRSWTSAKVFKKEYEQLIHEIQHNTNGKIICLSLNLPNERIEYQVPGSTKQYKRFNEIIKNICLEKNSFFISLDDLKHEDHYPDGTHFSEEGNKAVAAKILSQIKEEKLFSNP